MKRGIIISLSLISIIFLFIIFFILSEQQTPAVCNDGTLYNECSEIKPYLCLNGTLKEKALICGCNDLAKKSNDKCVPEYQNQPKQIVLNYTLNGKNGKINFTVYENLSNYLSEIPRYIETVDGKEATLLDFKLKSLDEKKQKQLLLPLVVAIENSAKNKDDQARIAVSIVQNIPFGSKNKTLNFGRIDIEYYRYPYEVLYDLRGVCGEKSELLSFLLRELKYGSAFFYYPKENHEAIGIKCPVKKSLNNSGYCFIETTGPSIITDSKTEYTSIGQLTSTPQIIPIGGNLSFGENNFYEYHDAKILEGIRQDSRDYGVINYLQHFQFVDFVKKYGLITFEEKF
jgi:hypothetical protein